MRSHLVTGLCLALIAACNGSNDVGPGDEIARTEKKTCADGTPSRAPSPPSTSIDGSGALVGDGEVRTGTASTGGCPSPSRDSGGASFGASAASSGEPPPSATGVGIPGPQTGAGVLTAGTWDDNRNFERFTAYRDGLQQTPGVLPITIDEHRAAKDAVGLAARQKLDVSLVIDTTGSMGDELAYLQREFDALAATIQTRFPGAEQHWSLVLYKDDGDEYVVRWYDFRADTGEFRDKLAGQSAGGGGDFPEAADRAVEVGTRLSWRPDPSVAKLMFWVADAPHHAGTEQRLATAIRAAKNKGIHVYPVASSGIDELTELTMRTSAQMTGGRYLFLTSDSGVGGEHKEPSIPCYFVTKLDQAILRMVDIEMSGQYREPVASEVLRTGGDPQNGTCKLDGGREAEIY